MPKDSSPSAVPANKAVLAAGAVLWRPSDDGSEPEVAVIHRPRYDDWSLPKGKVDVGENEPVTAVREVREETGFGSHLGRRLAAVSYPVEAQGIKKVRYWAARTVDCEFTPNPEVDELKWLPVTAAMNPTSKPSRGPRTCERQKKITRRMILKSQLVHELRPSVEKIATIHVGDGHISRRQLMRRSVTFLPDAARRGFHRSVCS